MKSSVSLLFTSLLASSIFLAQPVQAAPDPSQPAQRANTATEQALAPMKAANPAPAMIAAGETAPDLSVSAKTEIKKAVPAKPAAATAAVINFPVYLPADQAKEAPKSSYDFAGKKLRVVYNKSLNQAGVYIDSQEVIRFRTDYNSMNPEDRALAANSRLYEYLINNGDINNIHPVLQDDAMVIQLDKPENPLAVVDQDTAKAVDMPAASLALTWTNMVRKALGAEDYADPAFLAQVTQAVAKVKDTLASASFNPTGKIQQGLASWYGQQFHGRRAADGSRFDMHAMTAAHRTLPFGTFVKVSNNRTGKSCVVKITDRGPYAHGRIIDLSEAAAGAIGMKGSGVANVTVEILKPKSAI
ncbi:MAG: septal ring lytic transglycosylase RlpA family protein [Candidatus Melainabacteria bacterium]